MNDNIIVGVFVAFGISITGIAYPILLHIVSQLSSQYKSDYINKLFEDEKSFKAFKYLFVIEIIAIIIWSFKLKAFISLKQYFLISIILSNSALILLIINTILLLTCFIFLGQKVLIYANPYKFINYIDECTTKKIEEKIKDELFIKAVSELLFYTIKNQNIDDSLKLYFILRKVFVKYRINNSESNISMTYPKFYYDIVYKITEEIVLLKEKRNYALEFRLYRGLLFIDETTHYAISDETFSCLWRNINLSLNYKQPELILQHWESFHQYVSLYINFEFINNLDNNQTYEYIQSDLRNILHFHYYLGGLLIYNKEHGTINKMLKYSSQVPPRFVLFPESVIKIFELINYLLDPIQSHNISHLYRIENIRSITSSDILINSTIDYMVLLYFRLFTIKNDVLIDHLSLNDLPNNQYTIKKWLENMTKIKQKANLIFNNEEILNIVGLSSLKIESIKRNNMPHPIDFLDKIEQILNDNFENNEITREMSNSKINAFKENMLQIFNSDMQDIERVKNQNNVNVTEDEPSKFIDLSLSQLFPKDLLIADSHTSYLGFESLIKVIINNIYFELNLSFMNTAKKSYVIEQNLLFDAIKKLNIKENYIIVGFSFNFNYYKNIIKVNGLNENKYKNTQILNLKHSSLDKSIYILKKEHLPYFEFINPYTHSTNQYNLDKISDNYELYFKAIDIFRANDNLKEILKKKITIEEMNKQILILINLVLKLKWSNETEIIEIKIYNQFNKNDNPNLIDEINSL